MSGVSSGSYWGSVTDSAQILFLQEKQSEILKELHQEIGNLKHENSELKFQLNVGMHYLNRPVDASNNKESKSEPITENKNDLQGRVREMEKALEKERSRVLSLESEFECLTQVLNDVRRTRLQYKNLTLSQHQTIKDLEKKLCELKIIPNESSNRTVPPQLTKIPSKKSVKSGSKQSNINQNETQKEESLQNRNRQRSSSTSSSSSSKSNSGATRRGSLLSLLPSNYKDSVATLPPIPLALQSPDTEAINRRHSHPINNANLKSSMTVVAPCRLDNHIRQTPPMMTTLAAAVVARGRKADRPEGAGIRRMQDSNKLGG